MKNIASPIIAGALIGIAATTYLKLSGIIGAIMFAFGLLGVVHYQVALFTGQAQNSWGKKPDLPYSRLAIILLLNILGCAAIALLCLGTDFAANPNAIIDNRLALSPLMVALRSIPCGFIMTLAVRSARTGNFWPLLFGVPTFIICGFPHCVADVYYYTATIATDPSAPLAQMAIAYICTVIGNFIGCNLHRSFISK